VLGVAPHQVALVVKRDPFRCDGTGDLDRRKGALLQVGAIDGAIAEAVTPVWLTGGGSTVWETLFTDSFVVADPASFACSAGAVALVIPTVFVLALGFTGFTDPLLVALGSRLAQTTNGTASVVAAHLAVALGFATILLKIRCAEITEIVTAISEKRAA